MKLKSDDNNIYVEDVTIFDGIDMCCSGLSIQERSHCKDIVKSFGGDLSSQFSNATKYLICSRVGSEKYSLAKERGIPVVSVEWLHSCKTRGKWIDPERFFVKPFHRLVFSITGFSAETRTGIIETIRKLGGVYSGDLNKNTTTHLVADSTASQKYQSAKEWGTIHIISESWIFLCEKQNQWVPEIPYLLRNTTKEAGKEKRRITLDSYGMNPKQAKLQSENTKSPPEFETRIDALIKQIRETDRILDVFENCVYYIHGIDEPNQWRRALCLLTFGGATVYWEWNSNVTHVLVGETSKQEYVKLLKQLSDNEIEILDTMQLVECFNAVDWNTKNDQVESRHDLKENVIEPPTEEPGRKPQLICVSRYVGEARTRVADLVKQSGHKFTDKLTRDVSILISKDSIGEKADFAKKYNIPIRPIEWLEHKFLKKSQNWR